MKITKLVIYGFILSAFFYFYGAGETYAAECGRTSLRSAAHGQQNDSVKNLQTCLLRLGYQIPAGATGYYGNQTAQALKNFYREVAGMEWHGRNFGPIGLRSMQNALAGQISIAPSSGEIVKKVTSREELMLFINRAKETQPYGFGISSGLRTMNLLEAPPLPASGVALAPESAVSSADRISETTVQVKGIDEPDIVKTDGSNIYFSREQRYYLGGPIRIMEGVEIAADRLIAPMPPEWNPPSTDIIRAFPPQTMRLASSTVKETGDMLLLRDKKILAIFSYPEIVGYDISDPEKPLKKWNYKLENNTSVLSSRLLNGKIYFVTRQYLNYQDPCPLRPMIKGDVPIIIPCIELYRPIRILPVDSTYTVFQLNPESGTIEKNASFVGSSQRFVLYMSPDNLYLTYYQEESFTRLMADFILDRGKDLYPQSVIDKIKYVADLDISDAAKNLETQGILEKYRNTLDQDERLRLENETANRFSDYVKINKRRLEKTNIVKISLNSLAVSASGNVPGYPLNQFSLDEYGGYLRIAVTVGGSGWGANSANDVYILDSSMKIVGQIQDLGLTERIFSARFIGDKGYLVTFRQIDPFYVLDLSNPLNPKVAGELKIPGFSSYLEAVTEDKILGIGREEAKVKISFFDVADPAKPVEKAKYLLDEGWTEVQNNHHAFLLDDKHKIFFLPGGKGGYVLSYKDDKLELLKAVSDYAVKRAIYLDDYLYIIGENKITALSELTWEKIKELVLR